MDFRRLLRGSLWGVERITGSAATSDFNGRGRVPDYSVAMKRFPDGAPFSERLAAGLLTVEDVDRFASMLAAAHARPKARRH